MILDYTIHTRTTGEVLRINPVHDVTPNEGGYYCEIYSDDTDDIVDAFVVHTDENPDEVARAYMEKYYK